MNNNFSVLFYLKKSRINEAGEVPIYLRITVNGMRMEQSTQRKIKQNSWDFKTQRGKGRSESIRILNNYLDDLENKIYRSYNVMVEEGHEINIISFGDRLAGVNRNKHYLIKTFDENNRLSKLEEGMKYAKRVISQYFTTAERLQCFIKKEYRSDDIELSELDILFIRKFENFLRLEYKIDDNTTMKYLKQLKKVVHFAMSLGYMNKDPFFGYKTAYKESNRGYLTADELERIETKNFRILRLDRVRDVFVFACYTGLSYSDLAKMIPGSISKGIDGKDWIVYEREKTGIRASVPLLPQAQAIIMKYKDDPECNADGKLLPVKSNQKLNSYLTEIADLCEIEKRITMHLARHTFSCTVTLTNGVPIETVSKMLGHTSLKTTQIYAKVVDKKTSEDMQTLEDKMRKSARSKHVV